MLFLPLQSPETHRLPLIPVVLLGLPLVFPVGLALSPTTGVVFCSAADSVIPAGGLSSCRKAKSLFRSLIHSFFVIPDDS